MRRSAPPLRCSDKPPTDRQLELYISYARRARLLARPDLNAVLSKTRREVATSLNIMRARMDVWRIPRKIRGPEAEQGLPVSMDDEDSSDDNEIY